MKKKTELVEKWGNQFVNFLKSYFPEREFNQNAKRDAIVHDLTHNNFSELTMAQTLNLKESVDEKLDKIIKEKEKFHIQELNAINDYHRQKVTLKQRVKEHIENPRFDLPVNEFVLVDFKRANETL